VIVQADGKRTVELFQWGLIPTWAKDPAIGNKLINARAETLAEKPSFKRPLKGRRYLVLADGFYEWRKAGKRKFPMRFKLKSGEPFTFGGMEYLEATGWKFFAHVYDSHDGTQRRVAPDP